MATSFVYAARTAAGRAVAGTIRAESASHVLSHLRSRSLVVTALEQAATLRGTWRSLLTPGLPIAKARIVFVRAFATMMGAAVAISDALAICIEQCRDHRLGEALRSVLNDIESGLPLSAAIERRPAEFPRLFVAMIKAGEIGGALDAVLERLALIFERERALRLRLKSALIYPAIVTVAAACLVLYLVATTIPAFASMFAELKVPLPATTRVLILVGGALQSPVAWIGVGLVPVLAFGGFRLARNSELFGATIDRSIVKVPLVGPLLRKISAERFARALGALLHSGVALVPALESACEVVGNRAYRRTINGASLLLGEGQSLTAALGSSELLDSLAMQLVRAGEETGSLDAMLVRIAEYYELEVELAFAAFASAIEPLLIVILGAVVGTIVGSILIPLYSMIGGIK